MLMFWYQSNQKSLTVCTIQPLMITYHKDWELNLGLWRTTHCQFWLGENLYGVRDVTHRGPQGLTAFWPSVCPLGWSIIHVGVMHLSLWLCIVSSTKRTSVGDWQMLFNASSSLLLLQQELSSFTCLHSNVKTGGVRKGDLVVHKHV